MKKIIILPFLIIVFQSFCQDSDPIITDRPTQSAAAAVTPKGNLLIEAGFLLERTTPNVTNITFSNFHFRYGIIEGVEIRLTQNYLGTRNDLTDLNINGLSPLTLGTKIHLLEEDGAIPQVSVIGQVTLSNGDNAYRPSKSTPEVRLNFANTLSDQFSLGYNLGVSFPEDNTITFYTVVLGYAFADKWTAFVEPYGSFASGNGDQRFNTGLIYLCSNNIQFDVSAGWGLSDISPDSFIGFGAAIGF